MQSKVKYSVVFFYNFLLVIIGIIFSIISAKYFSEVNYFKWNNFLLFMGFFAVPLFGFSDGLNLSWIGRNFRDISSNKILQSLFDLVAICSISVLLFSIFYSFWSFITPLDFFFSILVFYLFNLSGFFIHLYNSFGAFKIPLLAQILQKSILLIISLSFLLYSLSFTFLLLFLVFSYSIQIVFYIYHLKKKYSYFLNFSYFKYNFSVRNITPFIIVGRPITVQGLLNLLTINVFKIFLSFNANPNAFNSTTLLLSFFSILSLFLSSFSNINFYNFKKNGPLDSSNELKFLIPFISFSIILFIFDYRFIIILNAIFSNFQFSKELLYYSFFFIVSLSFNNVYTFPTSKVINRTSFVNLLLVLQLIFFSFCGFLFLINVIDLRLFTIFSTVIIVLFNGIFQLTLFNFYYLFTFNLLIVLLLFII
jgi:hypothetical protein